MAHTVAEQVRGASGERSRWLVHTELELESDTTVEVSGSGLDAPPSSGRAGWIGSALLAAGPRLGGDRITLFPSLRVDIQSRHNGELAFPQGPDPLTSGYTTVGLGLEAAVRVRITKRVAIETAFSLAPLAGYLDAPTRAGTANPPEMIDTKGVLTIALGGGWIAELGASYDVLEIQYAGMPRSEITPQPVDVHQIDEAFLFWIGARRALGVR